MEVPLIDNDVFERDGAGPADIVNFPQPDPNTKPAVTLNELFGDKSKLPIRFQADLKALRAASALVKNDVELEEA